MQGARKFGKLSPWGPAPSVVHSKSFEVIRSPGHIKSDDVLIVALAQLIKQCSMLAYSARGNTVFLP